MPVRRKRTRRTDTQSWEFGKCELSIVDYVAFLTGNAYGDRINSPESLREARLYHGVSYTSELKILDRERLFPHRRWR